MNQELENFFYRASHDLKQPIRNTKMFADILRKHLAGKECLDDDSKEYLGFIMDSTQKLETLVLDLIEYSSINNETTRHSKINMNTILEVILFNLSRNKEVDQLEFEIKELPAIEANSDKIKSLLNKLFSNSIKFRKPNQLLKILVACEEMEGEWKFSVEDNGIGIGQDQLQDVFIPFKKSHSHTDIKGSGLGLSSCKKIIDLHQGKIWLESKLGEGTTVYFTIKKQLLGVDLETEKINATSVGQTI